MKEIPTKRGRITFGTEKVMMEESWTDYLRNSYEGFWENGELVDKLFFALTLAFVSSAGSFLAVAYFNAPLLAQINAAAMVLILAFAVMIYEHWNNVEKAKFIKYSEIESVKLVEGLKPVTCPRFIIDYRRDGKENMRYVTMPIELMPGVEDNIREIIDQFDDKGIEVEV